MIAEITKIEGNKVFYSGGADGEGWTTGFEQEDGSVFISESGQYAKVGDKITVNVGPYNPVNPNSQ